MAERFIDQLTLHISSPYRLRAQCLCGASVIAVATNADCSLIAAACVDRRLYVFDGNGKMLWQPRVLDYEAWCVSVSADASRIAVGTAQKKPAQGTVYVFDQFGQEIFQERFNAPVWSVSISTLGETLAVATWDNTAYRFSWANNTYAKKGRVFKSQMGKGLYGIKLSADGSFCYVASYDEGIFALNSAFVKMAGYKIATGLYNLDISRDGESVVVGRVDGNISVIYPENPQQTILLQLSQRPICGISVSQDGEIILAGSFDGKTYCCSRQGAILWTFESLGEVWSTALKADGSVAIIGSGDKLVSILDNQCTSSLFKQISGFELKIESTDQLQNDITDLIQIYKQYGLIEHGIKYLLDLRAKPHVRVDLIDQAMISWLADHVQMFPESPQAHFVLAQAYAETKEYAKAIQHYQQASRQPELRLIALTRASDLFRSLGLNLSANASRGRAREAHLDATSRMVLYNLARSYEGQGSFHEATAIYEGLIAWDINYRSAFERIESLKNAPLDTSPITGKDKQDFTGVTVSLLGPDIPRGDEVDEKLLPVVEARSRELESIRGRRGQLQDAWHLLLREGLLEPRGPAGELHHNIVSYLKYDYSPPEDDLKKKLELVHTIALIRKHLPLSGSSLDIGTATGRYPIVLCQLGFKAHGVDMAADAIAFAKQKDLDPSIFLTVANGTSLPFPSDSFDLITCMMGTLSYMKKPMIKQTLEEVVRCLKPNGLFICSTWDPECKHLSFLIMYDATQKQMLLENLLPQQELRGLLIDAGLTKCGIQPIGVIPDIFDYDLGLERVTQEDVRRLLEIELAAIAAGPQLHGQLFLAYGTKA